MIPLTELLAGQSGEVLAVRGDDRSDRLGTYGIRPGMTVRVRQTWPAFVVQVGETDLAFDEEIASAIEVRRTP